MFWGFLILLAIAIVVRILGRRLVPLVVPSSRLKTVGLGFLGGLLGSLLANTCWKIGPEVSGVYLLPALLGAALAVLLGGLAPFLKIMLAKR